jgi:branched-chain amino acid transport system substrate-binding protein
MENENFDGEGIKMKNKRGIFTQRRHQLKKIWLEGGTFMRRSLFRIFGVAILSLGILSVTSQWGHGAESIYVGGIFSLTGSAAHIGIGMKNAVSIAFDGVNRKGGIEGRRLEIIITDDESDPTKAVIVAKKMIEQHKDIVSIIGPTRTDTGMAIIPIVEKEGIPTVMHAGGDAIINPIRKWVFKPGPKAVDALGKILQYMKKDGITKIGFMNSSDGFGKDGLKNVKVLTAKHAIEITGEEAFDLKDVDMTPQLTRINSKNPQAIIIWTIGPAIGITTKNARALGIKAPIFQCHGAAEPIFFKLAGEASDGVLMPASKILVYGQLPDTDVHKAKIQSFAKAYTERFKETPGVMVATGVDAAYLVIEGIRRAGPNRGRVRDAIENIRNFVLITGIFNISPKDHCGITTEDLVMIKAEKGRFKLAE